MTPAHDSTVQVQLGPALQDLITREQARQDQLVDELLLAGRRRRRQLRQQLVISCLTTAALRHELLHRGDQVVPVPVRIHA